MKEVHDVVNFTVDGSERSAAMVVVRVFLVVFLVSEVTISFVAAVFNWGDICPSGDISNLVEGNHYAAMKKSKHFCDPIVSLFRKSSSIYLCLFVLFLPLIYFLLK